MRGLRSSSGRTPSTARLHCSSSLKGASSRREREGAARGGLGAAGAGWSSLTLEKGLLNGFFVATLGFIPPSGRATRWS